MSEGDARAAPRQLVEQLLEGAPEQLVVAAPVGGLQQRHPQLPPQLVRLRVQLGPGEAQRAEPVEQRREPVSQRHRVDARGALERLVALGERLALAVKLRELDLGEAV
ncbi:MAG: hypothetical protein EOO75_04670 [Myxococcales bacterium]|nr:MAG: hypothetical protein EOO75_04670 [Myxococcales bacterium]